MFIPTCRGVPITIWSQSITMKSNENFRDKMTQDFFTKVHLFVGKLVLVVAIHSLAGSRTNWHHMPNP
jgi:hypothetical protein